MFHIYIHCIAVDVGGSNKFCIDKGSDTYIFSQVDVVDIFYLCNTFFDSHFFGQKTGEDIGFG